MKVFDWVRRRPWATAAVAAAIIAVGFMASVAMKTPRLDRNWVENLAHMPTIQQDATSFSLDPVMNWSYTADAPAAKDMTNFSADFADLKNLYFVVEPQPGGSYAAHTLILFEFANDRIVGLTVEARLEKGEEYSALDGLFNKFELSYVWATAKDLLTRRVIFLKKQIYVYPLSLTGEQKQKFLHGVLDRTISVETKPRFYNTLTSNCTNELAKVAGVGWHYSWILTGYSPQRLYDLKMITGASFDAAREQALMTKEVASWNDLPSAEFDRALLAEVRRRAGERPGS
jgi:hypothetical protein